MSSRAPEEDHDAHTTSPHTTRAGPSTTDLDCISCATSSALACVVGTGTSVSCTEAALDACLRGGGSFDGTVTFNCGGAATITVTSTKTISADTTIDGGSVITISGGRTVEVFVVNSGITVTVENLIIANGNAANGIGGAILNNGGTLTVTGVPDNWNARRPLIQGSPWREDALATGPLGRIRCGGGP